MPHPYNQVDHFVSDVSFRMGNIVTVTRQLGYDSPDVTADANTSIPGTMSVDFALYQYPQNSINHPGALGVSYFDDFYNTLHFLPNTIDFGNIVSDKIETVRILNAFLRPSVIESVTLPLDDNLVVTQPETTPFSIPPLGEVEYTVQTTSEGAPSFKDNIVFQVDSISYVIPILGKRVVLFPHAPNWGRGVQESIIWKTDIVTSFRGNEQRIQLRSKPRQELSFSVTIQGNELHTFRNLMMGWQNREYAIPLWHDQSRLSDSAIAGQITVNLDTLNRDFADNTLGLIFNKYNEYEVIEITTVSEGSLLLGKSLAKDWSLGTKVYPLRSGRLPDSVNGSAPVTGAMVANLNWMITPVLNTVTIPLINPEIVHHGQEFFPLRHNWARELPVSHEYKSEIFDPLIGPWDEQQNIDYPSFQTTYKLSLLDKQSLSQIKALLGRLSGRLKTVLLPSLTKDFELVGDIVITATSFTVKHQGFSAYDLSKINKAIYIKFSDGTFHLSDIVSVNELDEETEVIQIAEPFEVNRSVDEVTTIQLVRLGRSVSDGFTINHLSDTVSEVDISMLSVNE